MTKQQFAKALADLKLAPSSKLAARLLGVNNRMIFYYLAGTCPVARPVETLVQLLLWLDEAGFPPEVIGAGLAPRTGEPAGKHP